MAVKAAEREREEAARLPEGDVVRTLLEQHARIRELFGDLRTARGEHRRQAFDELRALLAVHETAEEMVLRPVTKRVAGPEVADARDREEAEATWELRELEKMDIFSPEFAARLDAFERSVSEHADREEQEEFPVVRAQCEPDKRRSMGDSLRAVERFAPTHPHPSAAGSPLRQWTVGPIASIIDRSKDAIRSRARVGDGGA
ncbi:hemerythrin domain-containing protein [Frankia sp. CNm7]|uniref:Hemerythrin domain-containing protein n=1 Tax=Frankia nepalensis TaxID=1836974 RepID=A0A937RGH4_9ACTN|nr:hemerythrin domain-containing protein [Frankia nepalensis]MBL7500428.1 hemerythrin domain-containing protein [Frankia nepalensis]MBL7511085.1 hemerythrin domain-containing protein [Frankia nepalensis]MBL7523116.1 hemerythrin domain-containing protein [Frankia nepalensis]MBL7626949.1 hemerythrin domain-containing protein [Frankia nepalensis]